MGRGQLILGPIQLGVEPLAHFGDLLVGGILSCLIAAFFELLLALAHSRVQLELGIGEDFDGGVAIQVILQLRADRGPEARFVDRSFDQCVVAFLQWLGPKVAIIDIDRNRLPGIEVRSQGRNDGFPFLFVPQLRFGLVVNQFHASRHYGFEASSGGVGADFGCPRSRRVQVVHRYPGGNLGSDRRLIIGQHLAGLLGLHLRGGHLLSLGSIRRQFLHLIPSERSPQVGHSPARREDRRFLIPGVVHEELTLVQPADHVIDRLHIATARGRFKCLEDPGLVALGLQAADHPRPGVRHRLVVEVDRVLGRQHQPDAECSSLLEHRENRLLRGRIGRWGNETKDFIHVHEGPQVGGA